MKRLLLAIAMVASATIAHAQYNPAQPGYVPPPQAGMPALQRATVTIPAAAVATLHSAPYTLVAASGSDVLIAETVHISKPAGTGWTTTSSGNLKVTWSGALNSNMMLLYDQTTTTNFFGAGAQTWVAVGAGNHSFGNYGVQFPAAQNVGGSGIVLYLATNNISGGTGALTVNVWYRTWPVALP